MDTLIDVMAELDARDEYFKKMYEKDRLFIFLNDDSQVRGFISYFISDNPRTRTDIWSLPDDNPQGKYICLDRLVTDKQGGVRDNKRSFFNFIKLKHPNKQIMWHSRRGNHEIFPKNS